MKKTALFFCLFLLAAFTGDGPYRNGKYSGTSRSIYVEEPYYGHVQISIQKGRIIRVDFQVRDSARHETFDGNYERHFAGNDLYMQQCRNDWKGVQSYPDSLLKYQDLGRLDAISGATWSYNIFKAAAKEALSTAVKKSKE